MLIFRQKSFPWGQQIPAPCLLLQVVSNQSQQSIQLSRMPAFCPCSLKLRARWQLSSEQHFQVRTCIAFFDPAVNLRLLLNNQVALLEPKGASPYQAGNFPGPELCLLATWSSQQQQFLQAGKAFQKARLPVRVAPANNNSSDLRVFHVRAAGFWGHWQKQTNLQQNGKDVDQNHFQLQRNSS
eukprot:1142488-Pelagomonas_calceolata.AAC.9